MFWDDNSGLASAFNELKNWNFGGSFVLEKQQKNGSKGQNKLLRQRMKEKK
jgi:hypothetical protein